MPTDTRDLLVRILGDDRSLQAAFTRTERRTKQFQTRTTAITSGLTRGFAAAGVTLGAGLAIGKANEMVNVASDLNEQISRTKVILGESADAMLEWSETTASAMGISQREALATSATFAGLFQTVGVNQREAGELSRSLVQLAADLASLQNSSPEEALLALRSGLAGEAEPLRRFNIFLTEARVQQEAMAETGKKNVAALTQQEKTLARYNLILRDAEPAMGNFADTSDELANKQRIARAEMDDLSATLGQALIPAFELGTIAMIGFAGGLNDLIGGLAGVRKELRETDAFDGWNRGVESASSSVGDFFERIRDGIPLLGDLRNAVTGGFGSIGDTPEGRTTFRGGADALDNLREGQKRQAQLLDEAEKSVDRNKDAFDAFAKGLGLKIDKARLTQTLSDDLSALRELERAIQRRIASEGKTFKLVEQLTRVRLQISETAERQASEAQQASEDAFDATIDALTLDLDMARATKRLGDDLAALRAIEKAILDRIKAEGRTTELLRQLFDVREQQREVARQVREQAEAARQGRQFEALGLTEEGEKRGPSVRNLRQRASRLEEQIKGTVLDTAKTRAQLARIAKVLSGQFGKVGKDVRAAILAMLNDITSALKDGADSVTQGTGEITRGGIRDTSKLVEGLGLTPEQIEIIRQRNRGTSGRRDLTAFGFGISDRPGTRSTAGLGFGGGHGAALIVNGDVTVISNDPDDMLRKLQKRGKRQAPSRRGRDGGRNLGLG
jgi:hypothetical protein